MIEVGECYFNRKIDHLVVVVSKKEDVYLLFSITSGNFDTSCCLKIEDIKDNNNNYVLKHNSYVCYKYAYEIRKDEYKTLETFRKIYDFRCQIENEILNKIINGAKKSKFLAGKFKKYF